MNRRGFLGMLGGIVGALGIAVKAKPGQFVVTEVDRKSGTITVDSHLESPNCCPGGLAWHINHGKPYKGFSPRDYHTGGY